MSDPSDRQCDMSELLPCPFCNGGVTYTFYEDVDRVDSDGVHHTEDHHEILCEAGCYFQSQQSPEEWNTRTESKPASEWVSVEDRLPDSEDEYLIYPEGKYSGPTLYFNIHCDIHGHVKNAFESESEYGEVSQHNYITHWMPLPTPPQTKEVFDGEDTNT